MNTYLHIYTRTYSNTKHLMDFITYKRTFGPLPPCCADMHSYSWILQATGRQKSCSRVCSSPISASLAFAFGMERSRFVWLSIAATYMHSYKQTNALARTCTPRGHPKIPLPYNCENARSCPVLRSETRAARVPQGLAMPKHKRHAKKRCNAQLGR